MTKIDFKRKLALLTTLILFISLFSGGCSLVSKKSGTKVLKPKTHKRFYDPKKDKQAKRTKTVFMK